MHTRSYRRRILKDWVDHPNYNCEVTLEDGRQYRVYANWLHNEQLDHWHGWHCSAGAQRVFIDRNLQVYGGECQNDLLGSAQETFDLLISTVCKRSTCTGCTDDLMVEKHQADSTGTQHA